ncbi:MAG: toxin-antitoxin system, antitoxin component, partial [Deltaproteobacteria bacterium CG12_big_fil_rev_8_21_14_0_65_43_10]
MPARNPRINVVLEEPLYATIERLAKRDKVSLSLKVRDLIIEA